MGPPALLPNEINAAFPLTRPDWDYNTPAGREQLRLYRQVLLAGLKGVRRRPTNLAQVRAVTQGPEETPAASLRGSWRHTVRTPLSILVALNKGEMSPWPLQDSQLRTLDISYKG